MPSVVALWDTFAVNWAYPSSEEFRNFGVTNIHVQPLITIVPRP
jgi:hypothetical protein